MSSAANIAEPMVATCSPSQSIDPSVSSRLTYMTMPQISSTVGHATFDTASLVACGDTSESTSAIDSATKPTSTSNASATPISTTMPIKVSTMSRVSGGTSAAAAAAEPPAIGL